MSLLTEKLDDKASNVYARKKSQSKYNTNNKNKKERQICFLASFASGRLVCAAAFLLYPSLRSPDGQSGSPVHARAAKNLAQYFARAYGDKESSSLKKNSSLLFLEDLEFFGPTRLPRYSVLGYVWVKMAKPCLSLFCAWRNGFATRKA